MNEQTRLIDELMTRLQAVEIQQAATALQNQHLAASNIVKNHLVLGSASALLPTPWLDLAALSGIQLHLLQKLCQHYGVAFNQQQGKALLSALITGSAPIALLLGLSSTGKWLPGIGTLGGSMSLTVLNVAALYATGRVLIRHFESGGTLANFDHRVWQRQFKQQFYAAQLILQQKQGLFKPAASPQPFTASPF